MLRKFDLDASKTYATPQNAEAAAEKKFGGTDLRYFVAEKDGRFFPVFVGEKALTAQVHFHFTVIM